MQLVYNENDTALEWNNKSFVKSQQFVYDQCGLTECN